MGKLAKNWLESGHKLWCQVTYVIRYALIRMPPWPCAVERYLLSTSYKAIIIIV